MTHVPRTTVSLTVVTICVMVFGTVTAWANDPSYGHAGGHGYGKGMMHSGTGHLIRHLLHHEKALGLTADQVAKLKDIQLGLDKTRIKAEADIQIAERELKALTEDDKADLGTIEAKLKQSEDLQIGLRMTSIKTHREVMGLLTPEQRAKEKLEHGKAMHQNKNHGTPHGGNPHGSGMPYGTNPHGGNPHGGYPQGKNPHESPMPPNTPNNLSVQ